VGDSEKDGGKGKGDDKPLALDYRSNKDVPAWVQEVIQTQFAIETEDAKSAGALGYMAQALVRATLPYKDPKADAFTRTNGDFKLRIVAGYEGGVPYGIYPRLLMSWITTEAVRNQSPVIELGDSLRLFLRDVLELRSTGGGKRGSGARVTEQMKRLFGSMLTAYYTNDSPDSPRRFQLRNVTIADELDLDLDEADRLDNADAEPSVEGKDSALWVPQASHEAGQWRSNVRLNSRFFRECIENPVPIDLRAYKALRGSPLAMDVYTWLTFRMSYTRKNTKPIPWRFLMSEFGSSYSTEEDQAVRDFKKAFLKALSMVRIVYPQAQIKLHENGLILLPSPTHIPMQYPQRDLF